MAKKREALQAQHLDPAARGRLENTVGTIGAAPARVDARLAHLAANPAPSPKLKQERETLQLARPHLRDVPVTTASAARGRSTLYREAVAEHPGEAPAGSGWYFSHHSDIRNAAQQHGFDTHTAITASATMSPQNSPENEKAAVSGLMALHAHHSVKMTPWLHQQLSDSGAHVDPSHVGQNVPFSALHPTAIAAMSTERIRDAVKTTQRRGRNQPDLLKEVARGGTKGNIVQAIGVLRGDKDATEAINPQTSPKVWSYANAIHNAVPNSPEHVEYMSRVASHATGQEALDLYGMRHATHGILDPRGHTAEDTWMNSITSGQHIAPVPTGRRGRSSQLSPAKTYGSGVGYVSSKKDPVSGKSVTSDADVKPSAIQHAFNNNATQRAASNLSRGTGFRLPSVAVQEVSWTQARRVAGADTEYKAASAPTRAEPPAQLHGQLDIFGGESRTKDVGVHKMPLNAAQFEEPTGKERVKAEAANTAIQNNRRAKRRREGRSTDTSAKALGNEPYAGWG